MPEYASRKSKSDSLTSSISGVDVKCIVLDFTYPTVSGNWEITHNLPDTAKVVGFSVGFEYNGSINQCMPPNYDASVGFLYQAYVNTDTISFRSIDDSRLLGRNGHAIIWFYE